MKLLRNFVLLVLILIVLPSCTSFNVEEKCPTKEIVGAATFIATDGQSIHAVYCSNSRVYLAFPDGSSEVLIRAFSASGARFKSDNNEWWEHQGESTYSVAGKRIFAGKKK